MFSSYVIRKVMRISRSLAITVSDIIPNDWNYVKLKVVDRGKDRVVIEIVKVI